ncbi:hypothetical protein TNCV_220961 [Trichonephila clavipes]|nr:hypothetical protein TNCV_220961 [Trichonephila clavipes]
MPDIDGGSPFEKLDKQWGLVVNKEGHHDLTRTESRIPPYDNVVDDSKTGSIRVLRCSAVSWLKTHSGQIFRKFNAPDKALLVELFYMNEKSTTIALRKFQVEKNVKSGKGPLTPAGLLKLVKRFEETGKLEDRARAGRPCLKEARAPCIAVEMEVIASEAAFRNQQCS